MDQLARLETAIDRLIARNRDLAQENADLRQAQQQWDAERRSLLDEIDRILERLDRHVAQDS